MTQDLSHQLRLQSAEVLDFGCGTGLLAIAALKMGAKKALGVEIDHQSAQTAIKNVELNGLSEEILIKEGSWEVVEGKYDLILANLVTAALFRAGKHISGHLKDHGKVVVSGFSCNQQKGRKTYSRSPERSWKGCGFRIQLQSAKGDGRIFHEVGTCSHG
jgi:ribosomal protein L11 methyltransferase